jgi:hypothetical protein
LDILFDVVEKFSKPLILQEMNRLIEGKRVGGAVTG